MKITIERVAIAVLLVVIIVFLLKDCSRPSEEREADRKELYETEIAILKADKAEIQSKQQATVNAYKDRLLSDSINLRAQESVIQALERKAARQRVVVDTLILNNPDLLAFVNTQQEVITELKVEIDTLKSQANFQRKINEDLIITEITEDKIEADMAIQNTRRIAELEKLSRRKEKKSRLAKVLIPVVAVAAFLLGSQL